MSHPNPTADSAINDVLSDTNKNEYAVVLKCLLKSNEVAVDYDMEDTDIEEIASELADTLPRIILFRTNLQIDALTKVSSVLLINFNPMNTPLELKGAYNNSFKLLQRQLEHKVKCVELNDLSDFRLEIIAARARGLTGKMAPPVVPVKQTYGRELV